MDDVYDHIAKRLTQSKDVITFSSLNTACLAACRALPLHIIIPPRWKDRATTFLASAHYTVTKLTWKRDAVYDIPLPPTMTSLSYQCCRVPCIPSSLPHLLHLDVHLLEPGNDPGVMLGHLANLKTMSITFSGAWGLTSIAGYSAMHQLERMTLRNADVMIMTDPFPETLRHLHLSATSIVAFEYPLPTTCEHMTVHGPECRYVFESLMPPTHRYPVLHTLSITCSGMMMCDFLSRMEHLQTCVLASDSIIISEDFAKPRKLKHLELHCRDCFAVTQLYHCIIERISAIPTLITTSMGKPLNLRSFL